MEEGKGGMIWENSTEACILSYVKQIDAWYRMLEAGALDDPEEWYAEGSGRGVQDGEHVYTFGRFMSMYGKNHHNIIKQLSSS